MKFCKYLVGIAGIGSVFILGTRAMADDVTAPLNGAVTFPSASSASDRLYVDSGASTIRAVSAIKQQGHPDSRIALTENPQGTGVVHVANVTLREGDSLYRVTGYYIGGSGGKPSLWRAEYNWGPPRLILEINTPRADDDLIGYNVLWTSLYVTLLGGEPGKEYQVTLKSDPPNVLLFESENAQGPGQSELVFNLKYRIIGENKRKIYVAGKQLGLEVVEISATSPNVKEGKILTMVAHPIEKPYGDPRLSFGEENGPNETNEITYTNERIGKAFVQCKGCRVVEYPNGLRWSIEPFKNESVSTEWKPRDPANPDFGGKGENAILTYIGLPISNRFFGLKTITLSYLRRPGVANAHFELFFPREAKNHPGVEVDQSPNWFFYWRQVHDYPHMRYVDRNIVGEFPGPGEWSYLQPVNKDIILIGNGALGGGQSYGVGEEFSGIDWFISTVVHEVIHVHQWRKLDALLPSNGNDCFRYGWSWRVLPHNHWRRGRDGQWGVAGVDDDGNGTIDDAAPVPPFEPGNGDDENLSHPQWPDWPNENIWPLPPPFPNRPDLPPWEREAVRRTDEAMDEHQYASQDWADPGKQHKTLNRWDD